MPPRLLLDGEDLRSLMLRVREEMGPDAKIVKAERIRTGGIAGFFAKEHYELTVEVPEPTRPRLRLPRVTVPTGGAGAGGGAAGIDALLDAADAAERADVPGAEDSSVAAAPAPQEPVVPTGPQVSTAGQTFADVLESMRQMVGPVPEQATSAPMTYAPTTSAPTTSAPRQEGSEVEVVDVTAEATRADAAVRAELAAEQPAGAGGDRAADVVPVGAPAAPEPVADGGASGSSALALLELGVPARLLAGIADPAAAVPLSQLVRRFGRPPAVDLAPGTVLVVVGPADLALRTATQMAHRAGLTPQDVVLAGDVEPAAGRGRRLVTTTAAGRLRSRVPQDVPTVVALGVPTDPSEWAASAELLEALEPDQAWAALDARLRSAELRRWLRAVGSRRAFDAVAASNAFEAQSPGTVLGLGVPVGWVDGLPANPVVWAAVLSERLADDARWD